MALALLLAGGAAARAAEDDSDGPARFHDVKAWRGWITATARPDATIVQMHDLRWQTGGKGARWDFNYDASMRVDFLLEEYESEPSVWRGRVTGSSYAAGYRYFVHVPSSYANNQQWYRGYSESEWKFVASGPLDFSSDPRVELQFHRRRGWSVRIASGRVGTEVHSRSFNHIPPKEEQDPDHDLIIGNDTELRDARKAMATGMGRTGTLAYPKQGLILSGQDRKSDSFPLIGSAGFTPAVIWEYSVYLEPAALEELRLEIEEPSAYPTWRPDTTPDRAAGTPLEVTARLMTKSGGQPKTPVQSFEWELTGTSREPGVAMNFPVLATDNRPDLELDAAGAFFVLEKENQRLVRAVQSGFSDAVKVVPYDWGGWSTLQVTAVLSDGRRITGRLKGQNETGLRVPKRAPDSHVADGWKQAKGVKGPDTLDDDDFPVGDGTKGDGLTLYQEYRGFYQDGQRLEGEPKRKDFFIRLKQAGVALNGVGKFKRITNLRVHHAFKDSEFPPSRVMNANRSQGAHVADQHGVIIQIDRNRQGSAIAKGGPGTPRSISSVDLMGNIASQSTQWINATVAHELAHCVNVYHHGEGDPGKILWVMIDGKVYEATAANPTPAEIYVLDENYGDMTAALATEMQAFHDALVSRRDDPAGKSPLSDAEKKLIQAGNTMVVHLAKDHGPHSGNGNCVMRYDCAETYVLRRQKNIRIWNFTEPVGGAFCKDATGTEVNRSGRPPQDRYGAAASGRGNCAAQILVNDAAKAPNRGPTNPKP